MVIVILLKKSTHFYTANRVIQHFFKKNCEIRQNPTILSKKRARARLLCCWWVVFIHLKMRSQERIFLYIKPTNKAIALPSILVFASTRGQSPPTLAKTQKHRATSRVF